jgi:hypothetical protein
MEPSSQEPQMDDIPNISEKIRKEHIDDDTYSQLLNVYVKEVKN